MNREDELAENLSAVHVRIEAACVIAGRPATEVTLIVVTKTWPASDVELLANLGVRDVAENKDQEALAKHRQCAALPLRWHFVGQLQRNKARSVATYADVVHSVDRPALAATLGAAAIASDRLIDALIQVDLSEAEQPLRGGVSPSQMLELAGVISATAGLSLAGIMAVAPLNVAPLESFARLALLSQELIRNHPEARVVSAGMSDDLEAAIISGATHVRVGSAVLGHRSRLR